MRAVPHPRRQPAQPRPSRLAVQLDVVDDAHAVAEPLGAADLQRLPDLTAGRTPRPRGSSGGSSRGACARTRPGGASADSRPRRRRCRSRRRRGPASRPRARRSPGSARRAHRGEQGADPDRASGSAASHAGTPPAPPRRPRRAPGRRSDAARGRTAPRRRRRRRPPGRRRTPRATRSRRSRRLHHPDRVRERLQVQHQVPRAGPARHPARELVGIGGGQVRVAGRPRRARRSWPGAGRRRGGRAAGPSEPSRRWSRWH